MSFLSRLDAILDKIAETSDQFLIRLSRVVDRSIQRLSHYLESFLDFLRDVFDHVYRFFKREFITVARIFSKLLQLFSILLFFAYIFSSGSELKHLRHAVTGWLLQIIGLLLIILFAGLVVASFSPAQKRAPNESSALLKPVAFLILNLIAICLIVVSSELFQLQLSLLPSEDNGTCCQNCGCRFQVYKQRSCTSA